jgi:hypothetical protein
METEKTKRWSCVSSGALVFLLIVTAAVLENGSLFLRLQLERTWLIFWANLLSFDEEPALP